MGEVAKPCPTLFSDPCVLLAKFEKGNEEGTKAQGRSLVPIKFQSVRKGREWRWAESPRNSKRNIFFLCMTKRGLGFPAPPGPVLLSRHLGDPER